jgi:uncharacterized Fe-S radical SAM superfamily protein PflX
MWSGSSERARSTVRRSVDGTKTDGCSSRSWHNLTVTSPAYLALDRDELHRRAAAAVASLADCRACPRDCGVNRLADRWSACKTGRHAVVASYGAHLGEEDCLRGWNGSGTIFFAHCNLRCVFCQNADISQHIRPGTRGSPAAEIAAMMLALQQRGCHNINFVTPEHVVPQVLEAVAVAVDAGLSVPLVYNTGAYDALESLYSRVDRQRAGFRLLCQSDGSVPSVRQGERVGLWRDQSPSHERRIPGSRRYRERPGPGAARFENSSP